MDKKLRQNNPDLCPLTPQHIRQLRPDFFFHRGVAGLGPWTRLALQGLWTYSDKEGRFDWCPEYLKAKIFPYDPVDFAKLLDELVAAGFVRKYSVGGKDYGLVVDFRAYQAIGNHESKSPAFYPAPQSITMNVPERSGKFQNFTIGVGVGVCEGEGEGAGVKQKIHSGREGCAENPRTPAPRAAHGTAKGGGQARADLAGETGDLTGTIGDIDLGSPDEEVVAAVSGGEFDAAHLRDYPHAAQLAKCCRMAAAKLASLVATGANRARVMSRAVVTLRGDYGLDPPREWVPAIRRLEDA